MNKLIHKVAAAGFTSLSMSEWKGLYWNSMKCFQNQRLQFN